jgi:short-subunit dehydrogenase
VAGRIYSPLSGWYCASKFALEGISDCMRLELEPFGIHVVLIEPGPIRTAWSDGAKNSLLEEHRGAPRMRLSVAKVCACFVRQRKAAMASDTRVVTKNILKAIQKEKTEGALSVR